MDSNVYQVPTFHGLSYDIATAMSGWLLMGSGTVAYYITFIEMTSFFWYSPFWILVVVGLTINMEGILELGIFGASLVVFSLCMLGLQTIEIIGMIRDFKEDCYRYPKNCHPIQTTPGIMVYFVAYSALAAANLVQLPCFLFFFYLLFKHRWQMRGTIFISKLSPFLSVSTGTQMTQEDL